MEKMVDLMYFGYIYEKDSKQLESEFISEIKSEFPEVKLEDAYDSIKGYRQQVSLPEEKEEDYLTWLLAHGWLNCSFNLGIMRYNNIEKLKTLIDNAKKKYPQCFKK